MSNDLLSKVAENLLQHRSVALVGMTNSGKTYWVRHELIPHLEKMGKTVVYLRDGSEVPQSSSDVVVCDEAETMFDEKFLHDHVGDVENYYSQEYFAKVRLWHHNYARLIPSTLFVITRNKPEDIDNLVQNFHNADWDNRDLVVLKFEGEAR